MANSIKHCRGIQIFFYWLIQTSYQSRDINPWKFNKDKSDKMLNINGLDIANTELSKLLGVHIDDNLNFTEHIFLIARIMY